MNKTLSISLVAALGLVGGGAYMLMGTNKNFSEYVPDTVSSMLGDYLPESLKTKTISDSTVIIEEYVKTEPQIQEEAQLETQQPKEQQEEQQEVVVIDSQAESLEAEQETEQEQERNNDNAVSIAMDEIQKSINEVSSPLAVEKTPDNSNASNITKEIDDASMKISQLDLENKKLEERFQNILRKNRELAKKLQDIDKQLAHLNIF